VQDGEIDTASFMADWD